MNMYYAKTTLEKESEIIKLSSLLVDLHNALAKQYPTVNQETLRWALEQAIHHSSLNVSHVFEPLSTPTDQSTSQK